MIARSRLLTILTQPSHRYLVIGGSVYVFEVGIISLAQYKGISATKAVALSFCLGTLLSFILQKFITFGDKRLHHKVILAQAVAYALLVVFNFSFTIGIVWLTTPLIPAAVSRTIALILTTLWNYQLYKTHIFHRGEEKHTK